MLFLFPDDVEELGSSYEKFCVGSVMLLTLCWCWPPEYLPSALDHKQVSQQQCTYITQLQADPCAGSLKKTPDLSAWVCFVICKSPLS